MILVIEDDPRIQKALYRQFTTEGYDVTLASDGAEGLNSCKTLKPAGVVLDLMLPGLSGLEVCKGIKRWSATTPVVVLSAISEVADKVLLLEMGADDYVTKPFSPRELVARVGAVLRRVRPALAAEQLTYDDVEMDVGAHRVRRDGHPISLGPTEFRLLKHFLENPGRVFSRERLLDSVWSHDPDIDLRTVDVHVRRLRKALNDGGKRDIIRTVRSAGYSLDAEV